VPWKMQEVADTRLAPCVAVNLYTTLASARQFQHELFLGQTPPPASWVQTGPEITDVTLTSLPILPPSWSSVALG
jgi:hypothetical protein